MTERFEDPGDAWNDDEYPDEPSEEDDWSDTVPCPECGAEVYEDAEQCPACGQYITPGSRSPWANRSFWWILLGLLGVVAVIWTFLALGP